MAEIADHPPEFYERILKEWRVNTILNGLSDIQSALLAAQFAGLCIAWSAGSDLERDAKLEVVTRAMHTACVGRKMVHSGLAYSKPREAQS